jgi:glycosyltransferase involved in cell wall biosynthesis
LKILIASWYFPPVNTIGSVRVGKFARFLIERGHDVGVVAGSDWGHPETSPVPRGLERVVYARTSNVNFLADRLRGRVAAPSAQEEGAAGTSRTSERSGRVRSALQRASALHHHLVNLPDKQAGWLPWAYAAARRMCRDWRPDIVFGSAPPFTGLVVSRALAARLGVPWVAELRDRWADDPYDLPPPWRAAVDQWLERRVLASAAGLVTVTEPWAEFYRAKYGNPVATAYNGYDPADFDGPEAEDDAASAGGPHLVIGYTGHIYPGHRDPSALFDALRRLGTAAERFRVVFHGTDPAQVLPFAERAGVRHLVETHPKVPYREALAAQRRSDVLLLMQWNDPRDHGHCPAKLFEYLAGLRPVLVLGLQDGIAATIVRERSAGFCSNDPGEIATRLLAWLREKETFGRVRALPPAAREGLSRGIQFERLEAFLAEMLLSRQSGDPRSERRVAFDGAAPHGMSRARP